MAQTTTALSGAAGKLEIRIGGTGSYTDISGSSQSIDVPEMTLVTGEAYTLLGDTAILTYGKKEPVEIVVNAVYTETTTEAYMTLLGAWEAGSTVELKWTPDGSVSGADTYTTSLGRITKAQLPAPKADSAGPILATFTVRCASVTHTT